jgi:cytidyltransferase-like protein
MYDQVYTVGYFNNFHLGHLALLDAMRKKGKKIFVGIYDDQHMKLVKKLNPIDYQPLEVRMSKVKEYAEVVFIIPSLDPEMYLRMIMDPSKTVSKCFMRADDIKYYPGWKWIYQNFSISLISYYNMIDNENIVELNENIKDIDNKNKINDKIPQILSDGL